MRQPNFDPQPALYAISPNSIKGNFWPNIGSKNQPTFRLFTKINRCEKCGLGNVITALERLRNCPEDLAHTDKAIFKKLKPLDFYKCLGYPC